MKIIVLFSRRVAAVLLLSASSTDNNDHDQHSIARRLETDRAALMEALERIAGICEIKRDKWIAKFIEEALAAARANFPTP